MKANLYADGAIFSSMTGSGSVLYGVFVKFS
jgi:4-diphosphocytidyl-2C-methyl-D-erythritol kinase